MEVAVVDIFNGYLIYIYIEIRLGAGRWIAGGNLQPPRFDAKKETVRKLCPDINVTQEQSIDRLLGPS